jgi:hypothetical protein
VFRAIEMPESTSLLDFVRKKSNGGSLFHKAVNGNIGYGIKGPENISIFILTFHVIIAVTFPL